MKNILIILFFAVACKATGQQLQVGDKIPDYVFSQMLNYKTPGARVSDFRGKLLLMDFWYAECTSCLKLLPELEKLQQQFGDKLVVLPVGFDLAGEGSIKALVYKRRGTTRAINLPVAVQGPKDSTLMRWFPTGEYPHEVWVDSGGTVTGITEWSAVTVENISDLIQSKMVPFNRYLLQHKITGRAPFLVKGYGSAFTGYIDSIKTLVPFDEQFDTAYVKLFEVNQSVFALYQDAYSNPAISKGWPKRVVVENAEDGFYRNESDLPDGTSNWEWDNFRKHNLFCYELVLPPGYTIAQARALMVQDLDSHFKVTSTIQKRKIQCLTLIRTGKLPKSTASQSYYETEDGLEMHMKNTRMANVANFLGNRVKPVIVDETGFLGGLDVDITLEKNYTLHDINRALQKYHLALREAERDLDVLVLHKNP